MRNKEVDTVFKDGSGVVREGRRWDSPWKRWEVQPGILLFWLETKCVFAERFALVGHRVGIRRKVLERPGSWEPVSTRSERWVLRDQGPGSQLVHAQRGEY